MVRNDGFDETRFDECDESESADAGERRRVLGWEAETGAGAEVGAGVGTGTSDSCMLSCHCRPLVVNGVNMVSCWQDRVGSAMRSRQKDYDT